MTYEKSLPAKSGGGVLSGKWGQRLLRASGIILDTGAKAARDAVKARFASLADNSDLDTIGRECKLYRAYGETESSFRARLAKPWSAARLRGTEEGILADLALIGATDCKVKERWVERYGSGGPREHASFRQASRFWSIIVDQPHPFGTDYSAIWGTSGDGGSGKTWGDGTVWGFADASYSTSYLVWLMRYHCPLGAIAKEAIIVLSGTLSDAGESATGKSVAMDVTTLTHPSMQHMPIFNRYEAIL